MTMTPEQMLREFHSSKAIHAGLMPSAPTADISAWVQALRMDLLDEEVGELRDAVRKRDITGIADAIADIAYVVIGTAVTYGVPFDAVFAEVHRSNMTKVNTPDEAKLVKGPDYEPPRIAEILSVTRCPRCDQDTALELCEGCKIPVCRSCGYPCDCPVPADCVDLTGVNGNAADLEPADTESRIVSFDLMPRDPDYYFVLTEALRDFAGRQRAEAADYEGADAEARTRWADTAEEALDQIEGALSTPATIEGVVADSIEQQSRFDNAMRHPGMQR